MSIFEWKNFFESTSTVKKFVRYLIFRNLNLWYVFFYHGYLNTRKLLHLISESQYFQQYWKFLSKVDVSEDDISKFTKKLSLKHLQFVNTDQPSVIFSYTPVFLLKKIVPNDKTQIIGLPIDQTGNWEKKYELFEQELAEVKQRTEKTNDIYGSTNFLKQFSGKNTKKHLYNDGYHFENTLNYFFYELLQVLMVVVISIAITVIVNLIAGYSYSSPMAIDVVKTLQTFKMSFLPVVLVGLFLYFLSGRVWVSTGLNFLIFGSIAFGNHYKLLFRDDAVTFSDLTLLSEAGNMTKRYTITLGWKHLLLLILLICALIALAKIFKRVSANYFRLFGLIIICVIAATFGKNALADKQVYSAVGPVKYGSMWKTTNQYMSKGFVYAFSHSMFNIGVEKPEGYSAQKAEKILSKYENKNIPKNKKVNVIMIMMEAYNDFSKYPQLSIDPSVYAGFKQVQAESIHGNLDTNIFAGGTVDTERKTVTGYSKLQDFNRNTNSYAWYFKKQGYNTQALHPGYGWFYNRKNVDPILGLDDFKYMENYYKKYNEHIVPDADFFKTIHNFADKSNKPYFNLSVTYQNHGPYKDTFSGQKLLGWKDGYNQKDYAIVNNYLTGIKKTSDSILELTKSFDNDKPTVIMLYGDHNPWLGEGNSAYEMMNIDFNLSTRKGYENYYQTPYIMWANKSAKKVLGNDFVGQGPNFSPMYLLPEFFYQAGIKGDKYIQYLNDTQKQISVFGQDKYIVDDKFVDEPTGKYKKIYQDFKIVEYYRMNQKN